jgi:WD40 repeat protein
MLTLEKANLLTLDDTNQIFKHSSKIIIIRAYSRTNQPLPLRIEGDNNFFLDFNGDKLIITGDNYIDVYLLKVSLFANENPISRFELISSFPNSVMVVGKSCLFDNKIVYADFNGNLHLHIMTNTHNDTPRQSARKNTNRQVEKLSRKRKREFDIVNRHLLPLQQLIYMKSKQLVVSVKDDAKIKLWKIIDKKIVCCHIASTDLASGHTGNIIALCSAQDDQFISSSDDGTIIVWKILDNNTVNHVYNFKNNYFSTVLAGHKLNDFKPHNLYDVSPRLLYIEKYNQIVSISSNGGNGVPFTVLIWSMDTRDIVRCYVGIDNVGVRTLFYSHIDELFAEQNTYMETESEYSDFSIEETICKDKNYVKIRKMLEEGNTFSLNKIIGISCQYDYLEIFRFILEYNVNLKLEGYNFNPFSGDKMCALETACFYGKTDIAKYILSHGIESNHNHINKSLVTCIDFVGDWNLAILLLEYGGDVNVENHEGLRLLSKACDSANYEMVQYLYEKYSAKHDASNLLSCFNNILWLDEFKKIADYLIRNLDIYRVDEYDDFLYCHANPDTHAEVMDMIVNEKKRRKKENIRSLLLISYKRRQDLNEDVSRVISSFL